MRAEPQLLTELATKLPLVPSDESIEALATEHGWTGTGGGIRCAAGSCACEGGYIVKRY